MVLLFFLQIRIQNPMGSEFDVFLHNYGQFQHCAEREAILIIIKYVLYTLFQNGRHFSILLFPCKLALMASLSNVKFKRIFNLERDHRGQFAWKQKNTKMVAILE